MKNNSKDYEQQTEKESEYSKIALKLFLLTLLVLQLASSIQMIKLAKETSNENMFSTSSVIVCLEITKLIFAYLICLKEKSFYQIQNEIFSENNRMEIYKLAIPSFLYSIQNNLSYYGIENMNPTIYQVLCQTRIITTAFFSVIILQKKLTRQQWISLFILLIGVTIVQMQSLVVQDKLVKNQFMGFIAVAICSLTSGFASVYFEKVIKKDQNETSIWILQVRLGISALLFSIVLMIINDSQTILSKGFFNGYNIYLAYALLIQGLGGLLVGLVIKYTDNILKSFANSFSVIITYYLSYLLYGSVLTAKAIFGSSLVVMSVFLYSVEIQIPNLINRYKKLPIYD